MHYCYMLVSYIYSHVLSYSSKFALLCSPIVFICNVVRLYFMLGIQYLTAHWYDSQPSTEPHTLCCIKYSKSNVYGDIVPIWLPVYFPFILHFVEHIYRLPFYHLLYDIDFTCHHIAVPMLWCDARGCDTATCCCDTATCYIQIHILLANSS